MLHMRTLSDNIFKSHHENVVAARQAFQHKERKQKLGILASWTKATGQSAGAVDVCRATAGKETGRAEGRRAPDSGGDEEKKEAG
jgi:hypothetical protein